MEQRYEWIEILGRILGAGDEEEPKPCANAATCSLCSKSCRARVAQPSP